jgi:hypothetical protein
MAAGRAIEEYVSVLDDAAFGAATEVTPKFVSPSDPAARWTGAHAGQAFFGYSTNYLVDVENAIIIDVEATTAIRKAEVLAAKRMIERTLERFDLYPSRLLGDSGYGSAQMPGKLDRLRLRGPNGARDEFALAATAQNLRKMAKLIPMQSLKPA